MILVNVFFPKMGSLWKRKSVSTCYAAVIATANEWIVATTTTDGVRPKDGS